MILFLLLKKVSNNIKIFILNYKINKLRNSKNYIMLNSEEKYLKEWKLVVDIDILKKQNL
jgi:hypothetical protein